MNLYELTNQYNELLQMIEDGQYDEADVKDTLDSLEEAIDEKIGNCAYVVKQLQTDVEMIDLEIARLTERKKRLAKQQNNIKKYMLDNMEMNGIKDVKNPLFTIKVSKNPPKVVVLDEDSLPYEYFKEKMVIQIDKKQIMEDLKNGKKIDGAVLEQGKKITIK